MEKALKVRITTPSRLHFGIFDVNGELGRLYGSIGLSMQWPNVIIEISKNNKLEVKGKNSERIEVTTKEFMKHHKIDSGVKINIIRTIPPHIGLGSGTQLKLAVATGLARLFKKDISTYELAKLTGRGVVSGIGISIFESGGFVIDGGKSLEESNNNPPPIIFRSLFPKDWFFVIAVPTIENKISGSIEDRSFRNLPKSSSLLVGKMCRIILIKMLPALVEEDIQTFGSALTELQVLTGSSFSSVQGGIFADNRIKELVNFMVKEGALGSGQSSWGPSVYGLIKGRIGADDLLNKVQRHLNRTNGGYAFYTNANNKGSQIEIIDN
jgi:beta-RFAP synthase